ncbi:hypothetical protein NPIL_303511 [Nephila pilipes]|uniref:Uncharacterized protein n=1 Tax=Nephila pilipes TaxID=299642 RepID=A0A8X6UMA4_NEPPI|nr:hypothetical protein NPIL_303511 [Nephila pilipes]
MFANKPDGAGQSPGNSSAKKEVRTGESPTLTYLCLDADLITRGCDAEELLYSTHWFCGPPFLSLPEEKWPISKLPPSKTIEGQSERRSKIEISLHCATEKNENGREPVLKFENYSSWERLRRLTAWIQRFCRNARKQREGGLSRVSRVNTPLPKVWSRRKEYFTEEFISIQLAFSCYPNGLVTSDSKFGKERR